MMQSPTLGVEFLVLNAFTNSTYGGNPAAVVFLEADLPFETLLKIGRILNQPLTAFIFPPSKTSEDNKIATFGLRWFTKDHEMSLCGHGTLIAAHVLFHLKSEMLSTSIELLEFETLGGIVTARPASRGRMEIQMPSSDVVPLGEEEASRVKGVLAIAFDRKDIAINFLGSGTGARSQYLLIELDEKENLAEVVLNIDALTGTLPYTANIMTCASSDRGTAWETRMFAPAIGMEEDHVCGSANCLLGPYWAKKKRIQSGEEMFARQVSARGGELWVIFEEETQLVKLRGEVKLVAKGQFHLG